MWWRPPILAVAFALAGNVAAASSFTLDTSAFLDGGTMPRTDAAMTDSCAGRNLSPPLHLTGFPAATRSFAVVLYDTDAHFVHWLAYGIPSSTVSLEPGFGSAASAGFVGGRNDAGTALYFGPCPPRGDRPHHYVFTAYALDLAAARLRPGLTRVELLKAIAGHTLAQAQITGMYSR